LNSGAREVGRGIPSPVEVELGKEAGKKHSSAFLYYFTGIWL